MEVYLKRDKKYDKDSCSGADDFSEVSTRDEAFLRALLHDDYLEMKRTILDAELAFLRSNPGTPFYVKFDYRTMYGVCEASVEAVSAFPLDNPMWRHQNGRARTSGRRMQIHVMQVGDGGCNAVYIFPLRSVAGECRMGMEILAAEGKVPSDDARDQADRVQNVYRSWRS
ncbi:hypothetical protein K438DRAFT_1771064 [Mycena galopus ATCC 62051]|nr:hypothetical protein K438DRAFT_1771064 [Mycena galopus ATCC 62051]